MATSKHIRSLIAVIVSTSKQIREGETHGYHWEELRALTNRERARLQTFPDLVAFHGTKESVRRQVRMALPPDGAHAFFEALFRRFEHAPYEPAPANRTEEGLLTL